MLTVATTAPVDIPKMTCPVETADNVAPSTSTAVDAAQGKTDNTSSPDSKHTLVENHESKEKDTDKTKKDSESADESENEDSLTKEFANVPWKVLGEPLGNRRLQAGKRVKQSILYAQLNEDRLQFLEEAIQRLQTIAGETPITLKAQHKPEKHEIRIVRMYEQEFSRFGINFDDTKPLSYGMHRPEISSEPKAVLEAQVPVQEIMEAKEAGPLDDKGTSGDVESNGGQATTQPTDLALGDNFPVPERLRIRSKVLIKILEQVSGINFGAIPHGKEKVVILRPFKILITFEKKLREHLKRMELQHREGIEKDAAERTAESSTQKKHVPALVHPIQETETYDALLHMRLLIEFMDTDLKSILDLRQRIDLGTQKRIRFADLWHLFRHGQEIRTPDRNLQLYKVVKFTGGRERLSTPYRYHNDPPVNSAVALLKDEGYVDGSFIIECLYLDFDGIQYGPVRKTFQIRKYDGERDIITLPVYPLVFCPGHTTLRQQLITRGNRFAEISGSSKMTHCQYTGMTLDEQMEHIDSQVILDIPLAYVKVPNWQPKIGIRMETLVADESYELLEESKANSYCTAAGCCGKDVIMLDYGVDQLERNNFLNKKGNSMDSTTNVKELSDDQKVLLPYRIHGFILRSRKWGTLKVDTIQDVEYNDGWSDLVLPASHKETVLALVQNHARGSNHNDEGGEDFSSIDLVRGKGKGLIILLHGAPGVGKTSTAECVADHTKRPLFAITCGDIGDNATLVELNLENNFQLAHRWGCVLLLDEADVFLQKRDRTDLKRNAIVSVFLRTLEYYSGILFLTTNRVGTVDPAFRSRIHISLWYDRLAKEATVQIWKRHIVKARNGFKKAGKEFEFDKKDILNFAKEHYRDLRRAKAETWNGRQIHNAFQTALALAEYEGGKSGVPRLTRSQFKKVADASKEFDFYLRQVHGDQNDADIARLDQLRIDEYGEKRETVYKAKKPTTRRKKRPEPETESEDDITDEDSEDDTSSQEEEDSDEPQKKGNRRKGKSHEKDESEEEDDSEPEPPPLPPPKRSRTREFREKKGSKGSRKS